MYDMLVPWRVVKGPVFQRNKLRWKLMALMPQLPLFSRCRVASDQRTNAAGVGFLGEGSLEDSAKKEQRPIAWKPSPPKKNRSWKGLGFGFFCSIFKKWLKHEGVGPFGPHKPWHLKRTHCGRYTVIQLTGGCIHFSNIQNHHLLKFRNFGKTPKVLEKILPKIDIGNQIWH